MHGVIKFALPLGHGLSDERSLTGNKGANEWWGGGGRLKVLSHEKNKKQTECITVQVAARGCSASQQNTNLVWADRYPPKDITACVYVCVCVYVFYVTKCSHKE